jgi:hypothetical protein
MSPREKIKNKEILIFDDLLTTHNMYSNLIPREQESKRHHNYAGTINLLNIQIQSEIRKNLEKYLKCQIEPTTFKARIRLTTQKNHLEFKSFIHADPYDLSTVTFLAPDCIERFQMATRFYQHIQTGLRQFSRKNAREFYISQMILENHNFLLKEWEEWICVRYKVGRTVCFSGYLFHSTPPLENLSQNRLTMECFGNFQEK